MEEKINKEKFLKRVEAIGFVQVVTVFLDKLDQTILNEFTYEQWRSVRMNLGFPELTHDKFEPVLRGMAATAKNAEELFFTLKMSWTFSAVIKEIEKKLWETGSEEEWLEIFKSIDHTDRKELKELATARIRSF